MTVTLLLPVLFLPSHIYHVMYSQQCLSYLFMWICRTPVSFVSVSQLTVNSMQTECSCSLWLLFDALLESCAAFKAVNSFVDQCFVKLYAIIKWSKALQVIICHMGSHSVTCHPAAVTFPPLPQAKLVLDLATLEGCKAELTVAYSLAPSFERKHCYKTCKVV